ncbi:MAG: ROK family protein [Pseudomonadota bacterium]
MANSIGIDIGGTNCRLGVFDGLLLINETRFQADFMQIFKNQSPDSAWQHILTILNKAIQSALLKYPDIQSIGIGFPGFIDPQTQCIAQAPNLPGLKDVNLSQDLSQLIGKKVIVENDALAAAYGEYCLNNKPSQGLIYIGLGTGVGGGLIVAGKPFSGTHGVAMEVGHIVVEPNGRLCGCGNRGCLEQYASATGVSNSYFIATKNTLNTFDIAELAKENDEQAQAAFDLAGRSLGQVVAHIQKIVDVPNVIIGGGLSTSWHLMQNSFNTQLDADLIAVLRGKVTVKVSQAGDIAGMLGAAMLSI